jgi:ketosteroid isomerase-like protein
MARDWDTLLSFCTDDIAFSPPNEPLVQGPAARPWLERFPTISTMGWDIDHIEEAGDLAWLRGGVRMTLDVSGQTVDFDGKYTDVARRGADGAWRIAHVMWSSNEAAPTA